MEERNKTNKEIFEERYPFKETSKNPIVCAEAIGYLRALIQYFPSEKNWAVSKMEDLMIVMLLYSVEWKYLYVV